MLKVRGVEPLPVFSGGFPPNLRQSPWKYDSIPCGLFLVSTKIRSLKTALHLRARGFRGISGLSLPMADEDRPKIPQRSKNTRISVSPKCFSGTARWTFCPAKCRRASRPSNDKGQKAPKRTALRRQVFDSLYLKISLTAGKSKKNTQIQIRG